MSFINYVTNPKYSIQMKRFVLRANDVEKKKNLYLLRKNYIYSIF